MRLKKELLLDGNENEECLEEFHSCWNVRGIYNSMHFSLKLRRDIHKLLGAIPNGLHSAVDLDFETVQAFSTYFHETIHWWQHVGSTSGFILSLSHPSQAHLNYRYLKDFLKITGPIKSIEKYNRLNAKHESPVDDEFQTINRILNNFYDIEFFRQLVIRPASGKEVVNHPLFECIGHSFDIAYAAAIWTLSATFDQEFSFFPDARKWEQEFSRCRSDKVTGHYYGSPLYLTPIGAIHIFEGQARFSQIQYLHYASNEQLTWKDLKDIGMLNGVYVEAFSLFLELTKSQWPSQVTDPLVGLFLLICDLAINPAQGFPFDIIHFDQFVQTTDPGHRFVLACRAIARNPELLTQIHDYSKSEYLEVSEKICSALGWISPAKSTALIRTWAENCPAVIKLLEEDKTFRFSDENLPIRVVFARFIRFNLDKERTPEFFCWPGAWASGARSSESILELFLSHQSLFCNSLDSDDIFPRKWPDKAERDVQEMFDGFFVWNLLYDLTRQWITEDGDFEFWFSWLTTKHDRHDIKEWACNHFQLAYGVHPDQFTVLPNA